MVGAWLFRLARVIMRFSRRHFTLTPADWSARSWNVGAFWVFLPTRFWLACPVLWPPSLWAGLVSLTVLMCLDRVMALGWYGLLTMTN